MASGETYFSEAACPKGHVPSKRYVRDDHCVACTREKNARKYELRKEAAKARAVAWRAANPERYKTLQAEYRRNNGPRIRALQQRWRKTYPEADRVHEAKRRALERGAGPGYRIADVRAIMKAQRRRCAHCRKPLGRKYHIDHIIALANGGQHNRRNIQISCPTCNMRKGSKDPLVFARELGRLI